MVQPWCAPRCLSGLPLLRGVGSAAGDGKRSTSQCLQWRWTAARPANRGCPSVPSLDPAVALRACSHGQPMQPQGLAQAVCADPPSLKSHTVLRLRYFPVCAQSADAVVPSLLCAFLALSHCRSFGPRASTLQVNRGTTKPGGRPWMIRRPTTPIAPPVCTTKAPYQPKRSFDCAA